MTHFEYLIQQSAERAVVNYVNLASNKLADELVQSVLANEQWKAEMTELLHQAILQALARLKEEMPRRASADN